MIKRVIFQTFDAVTAANIVKNIEVISSSLKNNYTVSIVSQLIQS